MRPVTAEALLTIEYLIAVTLGFVFSFPVQLSYPWWYAPGRGSDRQESVSFPPSELEIEYCLGNEDS